MNLRVDTKSDAIERFSEASADKALEESICNGIGGGHRYAYS